MPSRSLWAVAIRDTFVRPGARVGMIWIAVVAVLAIFAPFIANSRPLVMRLQDGALAFPLFSSLNATDYLWLTAPFALLLTFFARVENIPQRASAVLWGMAIAIPFLFTPVVTDAWTDWEASAYFGPIVAGLIVLAILIALLIGLLSMAVAQNRRLMLVVGVPMLITGLIVFFFPPRPPVSMDLGEWRAANERGEIAWKIPALVPFSPNDRLRDVATKIDQREVETRVATAASRPAAKVEYVAYGPLPRRVDLQPPNHVHWLGTTYYGEDLLSRMLHACRVALTIGIISTGIATAIGIIVGGLMGYFLGLFDLLGMRVIEILESLPRIIILLIITVSFGRNLYLMMAVIGLLGWTGDARFIRAEFLRLRNLDFVQAGIAMGLRRSSILFKHMLPNGIAPVLVNASFGVAGAILLESTLSFLGLGLGPDDPSWGQLLEQARQGSAGFNWWIALFPGLSIFLTVFSYILIGEAMRDALDPKLKKRD